MTAPHTIRPDAEAPSLATLATAILANDWRAAIHIDPRIGHDGPELYSDTAWRTAAEYAADGDVTDLATMLERNAAWGEFVPFARARSIELDRFDAWLADRHAWRARRFAAGRGA